MMDAPACKLKDATVAEEMLSEKEQQSDEAGLANLSLEDKIEYSTVSLLIYQRPTVIRDLISNEKNVDDYVHAFTTRIWDAVKEGWKILESIIVFAARLWVLILLSVAGFYAWKKYRFT